MSDTSLRTHSSPLPPLPAISAPLCDIPSGCCFFTGPWTVNRSSLRMLRRVAVFCRPLRPVLLRVSFPRSGAVLVAVGAVCVLAVPYHSSPPALLPSGFARQAAAKGLGGAQDRPVVPPHTYLNTTPTK